MNFIKKYRVQLAIVAIAVVIYAAIGVYQQQSGAREAANVLKDALYGTSNSGNPTMTVVMANILKCVNKYGQDKFSSTAEYESSTYLEPSSFASRNEIVRFRDLLTQVMVEMETAYDVRAATIQNCRHVVENSADVSGDTKKVIIANWETSFNDPTRVALIKTRLSAAKESYRQQLLMYQFLSDRFGHFEVNESSGEFTFDNTADLQKFNSLVTSIDAARDVFTNADKAKMDYDVNLFAEYGMDVSAEDMQAAMQQ